MAETNFSLNKMCDCELSRKKIKMDEDKIVEEPKQGMVNVDDLVKNWLKAQGSICEVLLSLVHQVNALNNKN